MQLDSDSKYIWFDVDESYTGKTKLVKVISKRLNIVLGEIRWYGPWRQYAFHPLDKRVWNNGCLEDVKAVIKWLMDERRGIKPRTIVYSPCPGCEDRRYIWDHEGQGTLACPDCS